MGEYPPLSPWEIRLIMEQQQQDPRSSYRPNAVHSIELLDFLTI